MADIPGLIEGAADGAGLGIRFLKHLQRTRVLLHLVDIAPTDPSADPVRDANAIVGELGKFSEDLLAKPRWLVLNKSDLLPPEEAVAQGGVDRGGAEISRPGIPDFRRHACGHARSHRSRDAFSRDVGEAPAQGNLPLPVIREAEAAKRKAAKKRALRRRKRPRRSRRRRSGKAKKPASKKPSSARSVRKRTRRTAPREEARTRPRNEKAGV